MRIGRILVRAALSLATLVLCATSNCWGQVRFLEIKEVPKVEPGEKRSYTLTLENKYPEPVTITKARSGCACVKLVDYPKEIAANEKAKVKITYVGRPTLGKSSYTIFLVYETEKQKDIIVKGKVVYVTAESSELSVSPSLIDFGVNSVLDVSPLEITIKDLAKNAHKIDHIVVDPNFTYTLRQPPLDDTAKERRTVIQLRPLQFAESKTYDFRLQIFFAADTAKMKARVRQVRIKGTIRAPKIVRPPHFDKTYDLAGQEPFVELKIPRKFLTKVVAPFPLSVKSMDEESGTTKIVFELEGTVHDGQRIAGHLEFYGLHPKYSYFVYPIDVTLRSPVTILQSNAATIRMAAKDNKPIQLESVKDPNGKDLRFDSKQAIDGTLTVTLLDKGHTGKPVVLHVRHSSALERRVALFRAE